MQSLCKYSVHNIHYKHNNNNSVTIVKLAWEKDQPTIY